MEYLKLEFEYKELVAWQRDLLIQDLGEIGFDAFEETTRGFYAFIVKSQFNPATLETLLQGLPPTNGVEYKLESIPAKNWNAVWESNFEPLFVGEKCHVRARFHKPNPDYPIEIIINPQMAFGTGHHQTTKLMMEYLLEIDVAGKKVLDMGCGTGILGILALKLGAESVLAIDNDPICCESAAENAQLNNVSPLSVCCGDAGNIRENAYDMILANINRNILLDQLAGYAKGIRKGGIMYLSGFYEGEDLQLLKTKAARCGFEYMNHKVQDQWVAAKFNYI